MFILTLVHTPIKKKECVKHILFKKVINHYKIAIKGKYKGT